LKSKHESRWFAMVIFGEEKDWKEFLSPSDQEILAEVLENTKVHRAAYMQSDDVKVAQLWCAVTELTKQLKDMESKLEKMEKLFKGIVGLAEVEKRKALEERIAEMFKVKKDEEREATRKIVDALMEF
jgi:Asp-tRNA(Asn)/Glu-tRNA(Gln) amidotransferase B subunit